MSPNTILPPSLQRVPLAIANTVRNFPTTLKTSYCSKIAYTFRRTIFNNYLII